VRRKLGEKISEQHLLCSQTTDVRATVSCGVDLLQRSRVAGYECSAGAEWLKEGKRKE
jgi:hypothetical protein